ncbi:MAG: hypothetical protein SF053_04585 [Bacteroidia bacterium]|nr:hypothetical protein [Bacteroidia bacterium]
MKMSPLLTGLCATLLLTCSLACQETRDADVADISLDISFRRTDSLMWACAKAFRADTTLDNVTAFNQYLRTDRTFLAQWLGLDAATRPDPLPEAIQDSVMALALGNLLRDSAVYRLLDTIRQVFPYDYPLAARLLPPLKRLSRDFSDITFPAFRTFVNGYIMESDLRDADQIVPLPEYFCLGLHYFMGPEWPYYPPQIPQYQRRRFDTTHMETLMMTAVAEGLLPPVPRHTEPTLLDNMIRAGIRQYFLAQMLPYTPDSIRLGYTASQMEWAGYYEARIYKELIDKLFSTDFNLLNTYLGEKPYTTQLSTESAPRIGEYAGWRIVTAYMKRHPEVTLEELCSRTDYEVIFKEARYKPE